MRWLRDEAIGVNLHRTGQALAERLRGSFNGKLRDELLNREWFRTLAEEPKVLIEAWRQFYNERRPHSALGYRPPAAMRREWTDTDKSPRETHRLSGYKLRIAWVKKQSRTYFAFTNVYVLCISRCFARQVPKSIIAI